MRIIHFLVIGMMVFAAAYVYRIKSMRRCGCKVSPTGIWS